jgi:hypothetical protein
VPGTRHQRAEFLVLARARERMAALLAFWGGSAAAGRTKNAIYDPIDLHVATRRQAF